MTLLSQASAGVGVAATAVIYGTDIFSALALRPAAAHATDASIVDMLGRVHHYGDRRLPVPGITALLAAAVTTMASSHAAATAGAGLALTALLAWLAIYLRISAPINRLLRSAATVGFIPADTRGLQQRWNAVIWPRAALQTLALAGLLFAALTS